MSSKESPKIKVMFCSCKHAYQDEKYGQQNRVHNSGKKGGPGHVPPYVCTVCGAVK